MPHNPRDLLASYYGLRFATYYNEKDIAVAATATKLVPYNAKRIHLAITNSGGWAFTVALTAGVLYYQGIPLLPGSVLELDWTEDFDLVTRELWGISAGISNGLSSINDAHIIETIITGDESNG
jgi:hypothetical protein